LLDHRASDSWMDTTLGLLREDPAVRRKCLAIALAPRGSHRREPLPAPCRSGKIRTSSTVTAGTTARAGLPIDRQILSRKAASWEDDGDAVDPQRFRRTRGMKNSIPTPPLVSRLVHRIEAIVARAGPPETAASCRPRTSTKPGLIAAAEGGRRSDLRHSTTPARRTGDPGDEEPLRNSSRRSRAFQLGGIARPPA